MAVQYRWLVIFAVLVVAIAPVISSATEFMVGDNQGWKVGVNYDDWAKDKQFVVGDSLVFMYKKGDHSVYKVNGTDFQNCNVPKNNSLGAFTGNDTIKLLTSGAKWYICGVSGHCDGGQKLKITVLDSAPPSNSAPSLSAIFPLLFGTIFTVVVALLMLN